MLKKLILTVLLLGFAAILIWGGINRTLAKSGESQERGAETAGYANQHQADEHNSDDCEEDGSQGGINSDQADSAHASGSGAVAANGNGSHSEVSTANGSRGNGGQGQGGNRDPLDASEIEALYMALDDEYHALAVYQSVVETFGPVEPFVEIAVSEERHIGALVNQLSKHGLAIPENPWLGSIPPFESVEQACATAVQAEIDNAALYDQLFSMTDDASLIRVFNNLSNASLNSHLPQFEACQ